MDLFNRINSDISDYEEAFDKFTFWAYIISTPLACLFWFRQIYYPVILNHWFGYPANVQFPNADVSWGYIHTFFYNLVNPPMYMANYFNSCTDSGQYWYIFGQLPAFFIIYSIVFLILNRMFYWSIWNNIIGPVIGDYITPIVDSAFKNFKR
jgi:hypothetical protein